MKDTPSRRLKAPPSVTPPGYCPPVPKKPKRFSDVTPKKLFERNARARAVVGQFCDGHEKVASEVSGSIKAIYMRAKFTAIDNPVRIDLIEKLLADCLDAEVDAAEVTLMAEFNNDRLANPTVTSGYESSRLPFP